MAARRHERNDSDFGFDCKCPVCSGEVPNQDGIMGKMADIVVSNRIRSKDDDEMSLSDWTREASAFEALVDLDKSLYMGRPERKMANLIYFLKTAAYARRPALVVKAVDEIKELAEKTGLDVFRESSRGTASWAALQLIDMI